MSEQTHTHMFDHLCMCMEELALQHGGVRPQHAEADGLVVELPHVARGAPHQEADGARNTTTQQCMAVHITSGNRKLNQ